MSAHTPVPSAERPDVVEALQAMRGSFGDVAVPRGVRKVAAQVLRPLRLAS